MDADVGIMSCFFQSEAEFQVTGNASLIDRLDQTYIVIYLCLNSISSIVPPLIILESHMQLLFKRLIVANYRLLFLIFSIN